MIDWLETLFPYAMFACLCLDHYYVDIGLLFKAGCACDQLARWQNLPFKSWLFTELLYLIG